MKADLVSIRYVGRYPACEVDPEGLGYVEVLYGDTLDVQADVARSLLEQPANWELVVVPTTSKKDAN